MHAYMCGFTGVFVLVVACAVVYMWLFFMCLCEFLSFSVEYFSSC